MVFIMKRKMVLERLKRNVCVALILLMVGNLAPVKAMAMSEGYTTVAMAAGDTQGGELTEEDEPVSGQTSKGNSVTLGSKIPYSKVLKGKKITTESKALLVNLTDGTVLGAAGATTTIYPSSLSELMTMLVILKNINLSDTVVISEDAASVPGSVLFGFQPWDVIPADQLLTCYLLTGSDDARMALVEHVAGSEKEFVRLMNAEAETIGLTSSLFSFSDSKYNDAQITRVYDMYLIMYELLKINWFSTNMQLAQTEISYEASNGDAFTSICDNQNIISYGKVKAPDGYELVAQFTGVDAKALGNQIVILKDKDGDYYFSLLAQVDIGKNISEESASLLQLLIEKESAKDKENKEETGIESGQGSNVKPTPTPAPEVTPTPTKIPLDIPTESNDARYQYLLGTNYEAFTMDKPPKGYASAVEAAKHMKTITVPVWKLDQNGKKVASTMQLTINKKLASSCARIFKEIYELEMKFPIKLLVGYSYRKVGGVGLNASTLMSIHTFGAAIDINYGDYDNDYYLGAGNDLRDKSNPYCIPDEVIEIFERNGWFWGGDFSICSDTMHFQYLGLDFLTYQGNHPFRKLKVSTKTVYKGNDVKNLQQRLKKLGFQISVDGVYGKSMESVVKKAQKKYGLKVTGVMDYKTWETIINKTHDMPYVF